MSCTRADSEVSTAAFCGAGFAFALRVSAAFLAVAERLLAAAFRVSAAFFAAVERDAALVLRELLVLLERDDDERDDFGCGMCSPDGRNRGWSADDIPTARGN
ncbi:MAG: hypothetical protein ABI950_09005 [Solirubrobacteraceae bacterium]